MFSKTPPKERFSDKVENLVKEIDSSINAIGFLDNENDVNISASLKLNVKGYDINLDFNYPSGKNENSGEIPEKKKK